MMKPGRQSKCMLQRGPAAQGGVALAIVMWFLAAMSLLVAGIMLQARMDIKLAQLHANGARIEAAADGAIQLALAELLMLEQTGERSGPGAHNSMQQLGEFRVAVNFTSVGGLIDLNKAYLGLLQVMFLGVEGVDENAAQELALRVVEWRSANPADTEAGGADLGQYTSVDAAGFGSDSGGDEASRDIRHGDFEVIEDLLLVPGVDRRIFEIVKDSIYVSREGQSGVDWNQAPAAVLQVLGEMQEEEALELALSRLESPEENELPNEFALEFQESGVLPIYRVDAMVEFDNHVYQRRRWVDRSKTGLDGLPWSYFRTDELIVAGGAQASLMQAMESLHVGS